MRNRFKLLGPIAAACALNVAAADIHNGLVAYWPLDNISTDFTTSPELVAGNDFTLTGFFDSSGHITGQRGKALLFDGASQYAAFTSLLDFDRGIPVSQAHAFTISLWVKGLGTGQLDRRFFSESSSALNDPLFNLGTHNAGTDNTVDIFIRDNGVRINHAHSPGVALDDAWHHIAWVDVNGAATLYIDGQQNATYTYDRGTTLIDTTAIGAILRAGPGAFFAGAVDDVALWERALTPAEIQSVMSSGVPTPVPQTPAAITHNPGNTNVVVGRTLTLTADASGTRPLTYQWLKDNQPIAGATTERLIISNVQTTDSGTYAFRAQNSLNTATSTAAQVTVVPPAGPNLTNGLVAHWPLNEVVGAKTPDVISGYDMDLSNLTAADLVDGKAGKTFSFSNARRTLASRVHATTDKLPINKHRSFTISFWAQVNGAGQVDLRMLSEGSTLVSDPLFNIGTHSTGANGAVDLFIRHTGYTIVDHLKTIQEPLDGTWHHIAFVQDEGARTIFIDGVADELVIAPKPAGNVNYNNTSIGGILRASQSHWVTGLIDEVAMWERALSEQEVSKVMTEGVPAITAAPLPLEIRRFTAEYPAVAQGDNVVLKWDVTKDVTVSINQGVGDVTTRTVAGSGSISVPVNQTTTYTLTLTRGTETQTAQVTVSALPNVAANWRLLENFEAYPAGSIVNRGSWLNPEGVANVVNLGANKVFAFNGAGSDLSALPLNSQTVNLGEKATLFFRVYATNATTPVGINIGLTEKAIRFFGDFAQDVGPYIRLERLDGEQNITVQGRSGPGSAYTPAERVIEPGKVYNIWIDIQNDPAETGDIYTVYMQAEGESTRTLLLDQHASDRNPTGTPELGEPGPDLTHLFIVANDALEVAESVLIDDLFLSGNNAFVTTAPIAASSFVRGAPPATPINITGTSINAAGAFSLTWSATAGASYNVLKASSLSGPWNPVITGYPTGGATGASVTYTDQNTTGAAGFYRISRTP